jgi:hypothetical protein
MTAAKRWMQVVGAFYVLIGVLCVLRVPIRAEGPEGVTEQINAGADIANFLVDTWVTYGVEIVIIGVTLLFASRMTADGRILVWLVLGIEAIRGIGIDIYKLARGYDVTQELVWIVIHSIIITTGIGVLRRLNSERAVETPAIR